MLIWFLLLHHMSRLENDDFIGQMVWQNTDVLKASSAMNGFD